MAVWTRGYCVTRNRSVFFIVGLVERALNNLIGSMGHVREANRGRDKDSPLLRRVETSMRPDSRSVDLFFVYQGERRTMTIFFDLKDDGDDGLNNKSVCMMMGCSGQSDVFIQLALESLSALGPLYFVECSVSDDPAVLLEVSPMSYLDACRKRLERPSCVSLENWITEFKSGTLMACTEVGAFGFDLAEAERIAAMSYDDSVARILELGGPDTFLTSEALRDQTMKARSVEPS